MSSGLFYSTRRLSGIFGAALVAGVALVGCGGGSSSNSVAPPGGDSFTLTVNKSGAGSVSSSPAGISCGSDCDQSYNASTLVTLTATPDAGNTFSAWGGDCSGSVATCTVTMSAARTVTATFAASSSTFALNLTISGGGTVISNPAGINCTANCSHDFASGTAVTLTATPSGSNTFTGWAGACSGTTPCAVTMSQVRNVTATFAAPGADPQLTVSILGQGSVSSSPAGISCGADCSESYTAGTAITLTATASAGATFTGWDGTGVSCPGTSTCAITLNANTSVVATFTGSASGAFTRVSVSGFGYVAASDNSLSCGSVPSAAAVGVVSNKCVVRYTSGTKTFTATPYNASFKFDHWAGACSGASTTCDLDVSTGKTFQAVFVAQTNTTDVCQAMSLVSDKANHSLAANFPTLTAGQSFTDPNFGTTIRRISDVRHDGRGDNNVIKTVYSTISAWNADESLMIVYRTEGAPGHHELWNGKTYEFIKALDDIHYVDLEQVYWDTNDPDILYGADRTNDTFYRYHVSSGQSDVIRNFATQCGAYELNGGGDPLFSSWDSKKFGFTCTSGNNGGPMFTYDVSTNTLGTLLNVNRGSTAPQAGPSGTLFYVNENSSAGDSSLKATVRDANLTTLRTLALGSGDEHGGLSILSNGHDTWNAVEFDDAHYVAGTVVQHDMTNAVSRVIVGQSNGYPYPPTGTHIGTTAFFRTGLLAASIKGELSVPLADIGKNLLEDEILFIDSDATTNPAGSVCRVGHHRVTSDDYWSEPHPSISPSGTRILFSSNWNMFNGANPAVNVYVVELPGYKKQ